MALRGSDLHSQVLVGEGEGVVWGYCENRIEAISRSPANAKTAGDCDGCEWIGREGGSGKGSVEASEGRRGNP